MTSKVVTLRGNGRLVILTSNRKALGLRTGDGLVLQLNEEDISLLSRRAAVKQAQNPVRQYVPKGRSLVNELLEKRRKEGYVE